jgi:hypothetical protein
MKKADLFVQVIDLIICFTIVTLSLRYGGNNEASIDIELVHDSKNYSQIAICWLSAFASEDDFVNSRRDSLTKCSHMTSHGRMRYY